MAVENNPADRRSLRLKGYDYAKAGAYFVTSCAWHREYAFGDIVDGVMKLSNAGLILQEVWNELPSHYSNVELDSMIIMPNHIHAIINLEDGMAMGQVGAGLAWVSRAVPRPAPTARTVQHGLPEIMRAFKSFSARRINEARQTRGTPVWQRSYYEHVVRSDHELTLIREYIVNNPLKWELDRENLRNNSRASMNIVDYLTEAGVELDR